MSMLWWQNGRDIDWFSTNLEKWIKPGGPVNAAPAHRGRYSKLKSCRLSKTCQTMMYIPQEQHLSYEEQLAKAQDTRPYKYSPRQEHYNAHYNYIRTTARRAYYKPETNEIVLADEYDKMKSIQRQNKAKNYDYLLLLQQFLRQQQGRPKNKDSIENITTYLNNNIQEYEQTDQSMTLKQFLQEGIKKYENEHLMTLKEFLQGKTDKPVGQKTADTKKQSVENMTTAKAEQLVETDECLESDGDEKEITLKEFLQEGREHNQIIRTLSPNNPFASPCELCVTSFESRTNPFLTSDIDNMNQINDELSFEEFLKERQSAGEQLDSGQRFPSSGHVTFNVKSTEPDSTGNSKTRSKSIIDNDKISFDEFLKERSVSEESKEMTLEEFLYNEAVKKSMEPKVIKSNEHRGSKLKANNINLKLSKSFNDRRNLIKENLMKKLTKNDLLSEKTRKKEQTDQERNENKITLYEFLKEEDNKETTTEIENNLKDLKLRTKNDEKDVFYEINNNTPEIKLNDNFIQIETKTEPELKYSQYEQNRLVCACDNQYAMTGKPKQLFSNTELNNKIVFIDGSFDYHRKIRQNDTILTSPYQSRTKQLTASISPGRRGKTKNRTNSPTLVGVMEDGIYGPMWPAVLLTYDKVNTPNQTMYTNESYA